MLETITERTIKDRRSLIHALNSIKPTQQQAAANKIAQLIMNMNLDYATKLELLQTAMHHRAFAKPSMIRKLARQTLKTLLRPLRKTQKPTPIEAHKILSAAEEAITKSRDKIILC